jgi:5'-phosphate synthase pdxT subunit
VLALQGAYALHCEAVAECGVIARPVREAAELDGCDALVLPGGESTTIAKLLRSSGLREPVVARLGDGMPMLGTCAGMILAARRIEHPGPNDDDPLGVVDMTVRRNAFGRQLESFEADLDIAGVAGGDDGPPFRAVFIRAPVVTDHGADVEVLCWQNGEAVMARQGNVVVCAFHPELTPDRRVHQFFVRSVPPRRNEVIA